MHTRKWLRKIREERNLKQSELAKLIGCSTYQIHCCEDSVWFLGDFKIWDKIYEKLEIDYQEKRKKNDKIIERIKKDIDNWSKHFNANNPDLQREFRLYYNIDKNQQITFIDYRRIPRNRIDKYKKYSNDKKYKYINTNIYFILEAFTRQNKGM